MKVLILSDSFKGSLSSLEVGRCIERGLHRAGPFETKVYAIGDGGEGTLEAFLQDNQGKLRNVMVRDPLGRRVEASYVIAGDLAVIEMAQASGLTLLKKRERNPMRTSSYGTGELIVDALNQGCRRFYVGLGGSATNDGGLGMAMALGYAFYNEHQQSIGFGAQGLMDLVRMDDSKVDPRLKESEFVILSDVQNPLCGPQGASYIYGPQKGADPAMVIQLDESLQHLSRILARDLNFHDCDRPGTGAAGGMGAGLMAFCGASMQSGIEVVLEWLNADKIFRDADLIITGEGRVDRQSLQGKVPVGVARKAAEAGVPVIALCGGIGDLTLRAQELGLLALFDITTAPMRLEKSKDMAREQISYVAENIGRTLLWKK